MASSRLYRHTYETNMIFHDVVAIVLAKPIGLIGKKVGYFCRSPLGDRATTQADHLVSRSALNAKIQPCWSTISIFCCEKCQKQKMKIKLFGHPLKTRAYGTVPVRQISKKASNKWYRNLRTTKWHPSYAHYTFQEHSEVSQVFLLRFQRLLGSDKSPTERRETPVASVLVTNSIGSLPSKHFPSFRW